MKCRAVLCVLRICDFPLSLPLSPVLGGEGVPTILDAGALNWELWCNKGSSGKGYCGFRVASCRLRVGGCELQVPCCSLRCREGSKGKKFSLPCALSHKGII